MFKRCSVAMLFVLVGTMSVGKPLQAMKRKPAYYQVNRIGKPSPTTRVYIQVDRGMREQQQREEQARQERVRRQEEERIRQQREELARQTIVCRENEPLIQHFPQAAQVLRQGFPIDDVIEDYPHLILGVDENAQPKTIKRAYYNLVLKYHPDKNVTAEEPARKLAAQITQIINDAFAAKTK